MRVSVQAVHEDDINLASTLRCMYLGKTIATDGMLWPARLCLDRVRIMKLGRKDGTYHHRHATKSLQPLRKVVAGCIYKCME